MILHYTPEILNQDKILDLQNMILSELSQDYNY